jgi:Ribbon-helix-helix protein, copG family
MRSKIDHARTAGYAVGRLKGLAGGPGLVVVPPKKPRGNLVKTLRVRVDDDLIARIDVVAEDKGRSRSDVARLLLVAGLELHEKEENKR